MTKKIKIRRKLPWIGYPGTPLQNSYGEPLEHGFLVWDIKTPSEYDVSFHELPNNRPYVTLDWKGGVEETLEGVSFKPGSRIRVRSWGNLTQVDNQRLQMRLREFNPCEITFKDDNRKKADFVVSTEGKKVFNRDDLRNVGNLVELIREFHGEKGASADWDLIAGLVAGYLSNPYLSDETLRNVKWMLRRLDFDNTFTYGEGNYVDITSTNGIVGIFGGNRTGKSSFIGTILYALFNATDRGSLKNLHVVNARKDFCNAKADIEVDGVDYVIERQTTKISTKRGMAAPTHLNVHRREKDGTLTDLVGEDRKDTEKVVRRLIGTVEDFTLTTLSTQGEIAQFVEQGSSRRRVYLSRFMDLDVFSKMYDLANREGNAIRSQLKSYINLDDAKISTLTNEITALEEQRAELTILKPTLTSEIDDLRTKLAAATASNTVTEAHVKAQEKVVKGVVDTIADLDAKLLVCRGELRDAETKVQKAQDILSTNDLEGLRAKKNAAQGIERQLDTVKTQFKTETTLLKQLERSLHILTEVPCGDQFPTCKFIKDVHTNKPTVHEKKEALLTLEVTLKDLTAAYDALDIVELDETIKKLEKIQTLRTSFMDDISKKSARIEILEHQIQTTNASLEPARLKLVELQAAYTCSDNSDVTNDRSRLADLTKQLKTLEDDMIKLVSLQGRTHSTLERLENDVAERTKLSDQLFLIDLICDAFAKRGLPQKLLNERLPIINEEIAKILSGVVDFTIEMDVDPESEDLEVYIDYGDSKRIIELGSGMEKMIASLAIRVALTNVSTLPKSDMLVIDEGFGVLDAQGVEACSRLLKSLKHHFRLIMFVTHVDGLKDVADHIIDVTKQEKDAKVTYQS